MTNVVMALRDGSLMMVPCGSGIRLLRGTMLLLSDRRYLNPMDTRANLSPLTMQGAEYLPQVPQSQSQPYRAEVSAQEVPERVREGK